MTDLSDLKALFVNTSLKKHSEESHTRLLLNASAAIMEKQGVCAERLHLARMLKEDGGIPNEGNDREAWEAGERFGFENPVGLEE